MVEGTTGQPGREGLERENEELRRRLRELKGQGGAFAGEGAEERYRCLFEDSPVALVEIDCHRLRERFEQLRQGGVKSFRGYFRQRPEKALAIASLVKVVEVNRAALALYRAPDLPSLVKGFHHVFLEDSFPAVIEMLEALAQDRSAVEVEAVTGTLEGGCIELEIKVFVTPGEGDNGCRLLMAMTDITERKAAARALREAKTTLEQRVAERTAALANTHEDLKSLLSIVSHDLRTPLINVKGFSGELRSSSDELRTRMEPYLGQLGPRDRQVVSRILDEDLPEAIDFIDSSINRINGFMETLLRLSYEGKRQLHMERIEVEPLVREILKNLAFQIEQRKAEVVVGRLPTVVADRISLEQILGNLLSNAVLYLDPQRPGVIEVQGERGQEVVTFSVSDNGRGISAAELPKVFSPFRRGRHQDVEGEGMGLAYVQALVRRHGGRIWCRSQEGEGAVFHFTLSDNLEVDDTRNTQEILIR